MTIHLPPDIEAQLNAAVAAGQWPSVDDAMTVAARQLLKQLPKPPRAAVKPATRGKAAPKAETPMTEAEFKQHLLKIGLVTSLPDPALDADDDDPDDQPITIEGEPLSETIIRERR